MKTILLLAMMAVAGCECSDRMGAESALEAIGFTDIVLSEPRQVFTGCSQGDGANHPFTAKNPAGKNVHGVVCCGGPLKSKGCTVRFD